MSIDDTNCTVNHLFKNAPPNACPFNDFRDIHNLPHKGINFCRLKMGKDLLEIDMVQVFGLVKRRSGYSFANVHNDKVLYRIEELYPLYMENLFSQSLNYWGRISQKAIVAKAVKGISISWANFGHETKTPTSGGNGI